VLKIRVVAVALKKLQRLIPSTWFQGNNAGSKSQISGIDLSR